MCRAPGNAYSCTCVMNELLPCLMTGGVSNMIGLCVTARSRQLLTTFDHQT